VKLQIGVIFTPAPVRWLVRRAGMRFSHGFIRYQKPEGWWLLAAGLGGIRDHPGTGLDRARHYMILKTKDRLDPHTAQSIIDYAPGNVGKPYSFWQLVQLAWRLLLERFGFQAFAYPAYICAPASWPTVFTMWASI